MSTLDNLSKGSGALNEAYNEAFRRIDSQLPDDRQLAKSVLSWISYAQRPLTTQELCHALAVGLCDQELNSDNIPDIEDILSLCAGLVTVDEESQIIRLVHYTTQDYLEKIRGDWNPDAKCDIASVCLTYLSFKPFRSGSCPNDAAFEDRLKQNKFLDYSARYWEQHVAAVQERTSELAMALLQDDNLVACAFQARSIPLYKHERYSQSFAKQVRGLHLTALYGLMRLSRDLLLASWESNVEIADLKDSNGRTPLMCAAESGHKDIVELLLCAGIAGADAKDNAGRTALLCAATNGHEDTVKLLLGITAIEADAADSDGWTPLMWAESNGHKATVKLLLSVGKAKPDVRNNAGWTPLMLTAYNGHRDIAEQLLSTNKVEVDAKDKDGWTALMWASANGHKDTVILLLSDVRVEAEAKDNAGWTALMWGVSKGHKDTVEVLLAIDEVDVDTKNNNKSTPLILAASKGHKDTVELLLSIDGIDLGAKDKDGWTALTWAAANNHRDTVKLLETCPAL